MSRYKNLVYGTLWLYGVVSRNAAIRTYLRWELWRDPNCSRAGMWIIQDGESWKPNFFNSAEVRVLQALGTGLALDVQA